MAQLTGPKQIFNIDTLRVDTSQLNPLGTRGWDPAGNEYTYLQGTTSVVARDWVVYDENFATTRLVADEVGPVAIAPTAIVVGEYGWFQIHGVAQGNSDVIAADKSLYVDGTAGRVDDLSVSGDLVIGAYSMSAAVSNVATVYITYPHVSNDIGGSAGGVGGPASSQDNAVARWDGTDGLTLQNSNVIIDDSGNIDATAGVLTLGNSGLHLFDTNNSHDLIITPGSNITADRVLTFSGGDEDRLITMSGNLNVKSTSEIDGSAYVSGGADVAIADGGTGASSAASARTNLGLAIGSNVQAWDNDLDDLAALAHSASAMIVSDGTDWVAKTAAQTRSDLGLGTSDSPQFTAVNIGAATDTTLARSGAGDLTVEGNAIYRAGGTDVPVADGGTGVSSISATAVVLGGATSTSPLTTVSGLGSSGQVLTSNGAALAPTWQAAAGGSGGTVEIHRWIDAADFALPDASFAARAKYGTTWVNTVLDFDANAHEEAYYKFQIPNGSSVSTTTVDLVWLCATGYDSATSSTVIWDVAFRPVDVDEVMDASTTPAVATASITTFTTANNDIAISSVQLSQINGTAVAGDLLQLRVMRRSLAADSDDNLENDAKLLGAMVRIRA